MGDYELGKITSETWKASCRLCGKPFLSDDRIKAINKVKGHLRDKHGRNS